MTTHIIREIPAMRLGVWCIFVAMLFIIAEGSAKELKTAHSFSFRSIEGSPLSLSAYDGKVVLVVNTASRCGFTRQYADLQKLWERYRSVGLIVLGVPSNDFGNQEPGTSAEIKDFCEINFDVSFPMTDKVHVNGAVAHPFYRWAAGQLGPKAKPRWNFHKYLISPNGQLVGWFSSSTDPMSVQVTRAIEKYIAAVPKS